MLRYYRSKSQGMQGFRRLICGLERSRIVGCLCVEVTRRQLDVFFIALS